jgi:hypothetical protein
MTISIPTKIIAPIFKGNTFLGLKFTLNRNVDGTITPVDLTGAIILIQFRLNYKANVAFEFSTVDNTIIISDTNSFTLVERNMNYDAYKYISDIKITLPNEDIQTFCKLEWEIKDVVSR